MKQYNNSFNPKGVFETCILSSIGHVPDLKDSPAGMAGCCSSLTKRAENALSGKRSSAMRTSLNLKIMTLVICAVLTLFMSGLNGSVGTQEADGDLLLLSKPLTDANDPISGTWVLNLSKSNIPSQHPILKSQIAHVVVGATDFETTQETTLESGDRFNIHAKAKFDGKDYPITGIPGAYSAAYQRVDKNTIKAVVKMDGKVVVQETGVISPDGMSLAVICYITDATGNQLTVIAVYEKK
jgi:hypothetical protein